MTERKRNIFLAIGVVVMGLLIAGGTYAYMTSSAKINDASYVSNTLCFDVDYTVGDSITGTLFQSSTPLGGLTGSVSMKINSNCTTLGKGTIKLNVDNTTDKKLVGDAHCENSITGKTINSFTLNGSTVTATQSNCTSAINGVWMTDNASPPLKYAVYEGSNTTPVASGFVNSIGEITLYTGFSITSSLVTYNVYVWLDGNVADNTYVNMPFSGNINASAIQVE